MPRGRAMQASPRAARHVYGVTTAGLRPPTATTAVVALLSVQTETSVPAAGAAAASQMSAEAAKPPAPESQDQLLEYCLLAGLRRIPPTELPCLTSDFYSKYMLPAKPAGVAPRRVFLPADSRAMRCTGARACLSRYGYGSQLAGAAGVSMHEQYARLGCACR